MEIKLCSPNVCEQQGLWIPPKQSNVFSSENINQYCCAAFSWLRVMPAAHWRLQLLFKCQHISTEGLAQENVAGRRPELWIVLLQESD